METFDTILNAMIQKGEAMKSGDISKELGIDKKDVDKAIKTLKAEGKIYSPKRCYYSPKQ